MYSLEQRIQSAWSFIGRNTWRTWTCPIINTNIAIILERRMGNCISYRMSSGMTLYECCEINLPALLLINHSEYIKAHCITHHFHLLQIIILEAHTHTCRWRSECDAKAMNAVEWVNCISYFHVPRKHLLIKQSILAADSIGWNRFWAVGAYKRVATLILHCFGIFPRILTMLSLFLCFICHKSKWWSVISNESTWECRSGWWFN